MINWYTGMLVRTYECESVFTPGGVDWHLRMCPDGLPVSTYLAFRRKLLVRRDMLEKRQNFHKHTHTYDNFSDDHARRLRQENKQRGGAEAHNCSRGCWCCCLWYYTLLAPDTNWHPRPLALGCKHECHLVLRSSGLKHEKFGSIIRLGRCGTSI